MARRASLPYTRGCARREPTRDHGFAIEAWDLQTSTHIIYTRALGTWTLQYCRAACAASWCRVWGLGYGVQDLGCNASRLSVVPVVRGGAQLP